MKTGVWDRHAHSAGTPSIWGDIIHLWGRECLLSPFPQTPGIFKLFLWSSLWSSLLHSLLWCCPVILSLLGPSEPTHICVHIQACTNHGEGTMVEKGWPTHLLYNISLRRQTMKKETFINAQENGKIRPWSWKEVSRIWKPEKNFWRIQ